MVKFDIRYRLKYDGSEDDTKWLMWYTGWSRQTATGALKKWKPGNENTQTRSNRN